MANKTTKKVQERPVITIDDTQYYRDSLPEDAVKIINDINVVLTEINRLRVNIGIAELAKNSLASSLATFKDQFEAVA